MTKKQIKLIKDLILFSKPINEDYAQGYNYVVSELLKETKPTDYNYIVNQLLKETNRG